MCVVFQNLFNNNIQWTCWAREERKERRKEKREMQSRSSSTCFRRSDDETTSNHDEISDGDSLQWGEHFYQVRFLMRRLDSTV